jgi:DNA-binding CsgD family transcriptional regulator/PAS domain-containing protein
MIYSTSLDPSKWALVIDRLDELAGAAGIASSLAKPNRDEAPEDALARLKHALLPRRDDPSQATRSYAKSAPSFFHLLDEHVRQAMQITQKISAINHQQHLLQQAFDRLSDAIFFLGQGNSVLIANRAASAMTKADDGLRMLNGALTATHRPTADKLRMLINDVAASAPGDVLRFDALAVPKPSGGRALHLLAMPAITSMEEHFAAFLSGKPTAFVVVSDPDQQQAPPEDRLQAIFGLTPTEAKLAAALASGMSIGGYAGQAGVTENTARWTLKQVQAKTDCRRQADLVRLLAATSRVS